MSTKFGAVSANAIVGLLENGTIKLARRGWGASLSAGSPSSSTDWVTVPLTIPAKISSDNVRIATVSFKYATGDRAKIEAFHVWKGESRILTQDGLNFKGELEGVPRRMYLTHSKGWDLGKGDPLDKALAFTVKVAIEGSDRDDTPGRWATLASVAVGYEYKG